MSVAPRRLVRLLSFLVWTSLIWPAARAETEPSSDFSAWMARGRAALTATDYAAAQAALEKAVALRPADAEAHYILGRAYGEDKKYQFATRHFREALRLSTGHVQAILDLAAIEENAGRFDEAGTLYRRALALGPNPRAERGLASLLAKQGFADEAIARLRRLTAAGQEDVEPRYQLGLALMQKGDCASAIPEFRVVVQRQASHLGALFNLGNCLNRTGARDEGSRVLAGFQKASEEQAAKVDRERRGYFLMLEADRRLQSGEMEAAVKVLEEAVRLTPENPRVHGMMAQALEAKGDLPRALESYRRAVELDPADPVLQVETGRLLGKLGRFADALPYLRNACRIDPGMPEPHLMLAAVYHQLGKLSEAAAEEAIYRRLAAGRSDSPPR